ncbi:MBL fold metallo-hydrolase [Candidatus Nomurabacteria bacterium RIFCSPLOWO2_01_FULL_39_18]|uniref:MBL fold metallo-hydrolase n=1 Tax=Candidatus Nomurabacteria bacterium RIFCSPHIGHO2_01_FULL_40_24b TaxID=1801739 RepID=A0A1F6V611_9BACT|nr:MAG: MBL fold metallo-hydrolase [Candidatus Nomurabacteria bacterium RIFCSPHIGHO2_01_FULL_40_24b]OGI89354.1 MAG: MBL fold metallo-hydrolase [Candidatus Nomurabacteria bacterium RIFCSPLOWO2_01_FULL_39_18]
MKKIVLLIIALAVLTLIIKTNDKKENKNTMTNFISIDAISHASMILNWDGVAIYADPSMYKVGKANMFANKPSPDIILLTDIHQDHFNIETLKILTKEKTIIIGPKAVADEIPEDLKPKIFVMNNGEMADQAGFRIEAMPMYNLPERDEAFHPKGRGSGYIIERGGMRVYISGDTSGIPEMRALQNIDMAFVAMNLPYTMSVEEAADAVLEFKPKKVYPYHYRTPEGFSDVAKFKEIVNGKNPEIEVIQLEWYP